MGAAWKHPTERDMPYVIEMVKGVKAMGLETCMTLGMLQETQAQQLAEAGLDYYNHIQDIKTGFYYKIITTRSYEDRINSQLHVRHSGLKICCVDILCKGETAKDRYGRRMQ